MTRSFLVTLLVVLVASTTTASAFVVGPSSSTQKPSLVQLQAVNKNHRQNRLAEIATTAAICLSTNPLVAKAIEDDGYEYGAVDAPIGLAWGAGVLAILTALLPVVLQGGEEAFEEMKDRDSGTWGTGSADPTGRKKK